MAWLLAAILGGILYRGQIIGNEWWIWGESGTVLVRPKWPFAANMGGMNMQHELSLILLSNLEQ